MSRITCSRCQRVSRATKARAWNVTVRAGVPIGHVCPDCQTPQENAEAEINLATTNYFVKDGLLMGRPKLGGAR